MAIFASILFRISINHRDTMNEIERGGKINEADRSLLLVAGIGTKECPSLSVWHVHPRSVRNPAWLVLVLKWRTAWNSLNRTAVRIFTATFIRHGTRYFSHLVLSLFLKTGKRVPESQSSGTASSSHLFNHLIEPVCQCRHMTCRF
uniref:Craniofacial development protein 2 n=1 Tax=Schistocephalus solidus TaxID=70667 RepID=A0A0X3Q4K9_SCHSO